MIWYDQKSVKIISTIQPNVVIVKVDYKKMQREGGRWTMENVYESEKKTKIEKMSLAWR